MRSDAHQVLPRSTRRHAIMPDAAPAPMFPPRRGSPGRRWRAVPTLMVALLLSSVPHAAWAQASGTASVSDSGPSVATGPHFRVTCHFSGDAMAARALEVVEATWPIACDLFGVSKRKPAKPLDVHVYRDAAAYAEACDRLVGGAFKRNLAFADPDSLTANVALQPPLSDEALATIGLPWLTLNLLAHEASHLVRYHSFPNCRSHPRWLTDGAAMWIKYANPRVVASRGSDLAVPMSATDAVRVQGLLHEGKLPKVASILKDEIGDLEWHTQYSVRRVFFDFLAEQGRGRPLKRILTRARRLGGGADYTEKLYRAFDQVLRVSKLDEGFIDYVRGLEPEWHEIYRSLETTREDWMQIAWPDTNAVAWRTEDVGVSSYVLEAEVEIVPGPRHQLNVLLDRQPGQGFISVALVAGWGVTVFEYRAAGDEWKRLSAIESSALRAGDSVPVKIAVAGGKLSVTIAAKQLLEVDVSHRDMTGPWGLGAQNGSAGFWRKVKVSK